MTSNKTKEIQYQTLFDLKQAEGLTKLGVMNNQVWRDDPKRLAFTLSRYKFVAKMLSGKKNVLEVGCGDAFASRIVQQDVGKLTVVDFDPLFISDIEERMDEDWPLTCAVHDMLAKPFDGSFDGIYALDVLEHIRPEDEHLFMANALSSLSEFGVVIIGIPSLESQTLASPQSREGHVNCKSGYDFKESMLQFFSNVFMFSMNDEVIHTGHYAMAHYLLAVCVNKK